MLQPDDLRHILHQFCNILQPIGYHVERLGELKTDEPVFNTAMQALPGRLSTLYRMIDRLRVLSKPIELQCARVDLCALLKSVWIGVSSTKDYWQIGVAMDLPLKCAVEADEYWIQQALHELFVNAAEAAIASAKPELKVALHPEGDAWCVEIIDSGSGFPPDAAQKELFHSSKTESGSGLGLPIAQHIVEAHKGSLRFGQPVPNAVTVVLPKIKE